MCGIFGIVELEQREKIGHDYIQRALDTMDHRGPDERGEYIEKTASLALGLGHCRLSIIDLKSGQQPLFNEDKTIAIVFNGEIYNFEDLKRDLVARGHRFATNSDTEVIVHLYEEFGKDCVTKLRGMFAFAIWDSEKSLLFLARDRVGKKPLYYYQDREHFLFASEMKALLEEKSIPREVDFTAIDQYLSFLYIPSPGSVFKNIKKLPPAHHMTIDFSGTQRDEAVRSTPVEYWDLDFEATGGIAEEEWIEKLEALFKECVAIRLMSEVPLGAFLSGGIDSSAVVAYMAELKQEPVVTNSIGFEERAFNELDFAGIVARRFSTAHHEYLVKPQAIDIVEKLVWHFDEPFADASAIPTYYVSRMARQNVTVALSGDGGDEVFAGYIRRYWMSCLEERWRKTLPQAVRKYIIGPVAQVYPKGDFLPRWMRGKYFLMNLPFSPVEAYFRDRSCFLPEMKGSLYDVQFTSLLNGCRPIAEFEALFERRRRLDHLSKIQYVDIRTYLPEDILVKVDRMSMANSLEVRAPLLDHKLIELVASMPPHLRLNGKRSKYIFKRMLEKRLPKEILHRGKQGFAVPVSAWLRGELREYAIDVLFSKEAKERGYFDYRFMKVMWEQHQKGRRDFGDQLWTLLMLELWHRRFLSRHG